MGRINTGLLRDVYSGTGSKPFLPELMLAVVLVEILDGRTSPAQWFRDATSRDQCKLVGQGIAPSRSAWYDFRDRAAKFIEFVHQHIIKDAIDNRLIDPVEAAVDGTFTAANASRHKIYNLKQINRRLNKLKRVIGSLDDSLQIAAAKPLEKVPKWIGKTLVGRARQLGCLRQAKYELLNKIRDNRMAHSRYRRDEAKLVVSPADPEAVIGRDKHDVVRPLYNIQYVTDCQSGVILSFGVFRQNSDNATLGPMIEKSQCITGGQLQTIHADASYCSILDLKDCKRLGIDLRAPVQNNTMQQRKLANGHFQIPSGEFVLDPSTGELRCPGGHAMKQMRTVHVPRACGRVLPELRFEQLEENCSVCPLAAQCLGDNSKYRTICRQRDQHLLDAQQEKMSGDAGRRSRGKRGSSVERTFGDRKLHRNQAHQHGRGLSRVRTEVGLVAIAQNILTLYNREKRCENASP
jgi:transposase